MKKDKIYYFEKDKEEYIQLFKSKTNYLNNININDIKSLAYYNKKYVILLKNGNLYINGILYKENIYLLIQMCTDEIFAISNKYQLLIISVKTKINLIDEKEEYKQIISDIFSIVCLKKDGEALIYETDDLKKIEYKKTVSNIENIIYDDLECIVYGKDKDNYRQLYGYNYKMDKYTTGNETLDKNKIYLVSNMLNVILEDPITYSPILMNEMIKHLSKIHPYKRILYLTDRIENNIIEENVIISSEGIYNLENIIQESKINFVFVDSIKLLNNDLVQLARIARNTKTMIVILYSLKMLPSQQFENYDLNNHVCQLVWNIIKEKNTIKLKYIYGDHRFKNKEYDTMKPVIK